MLAIVNIDKPNDSHFAGSFPVALAYISAIGIAPAPVPPPIIGNTYSVATLAGSTPTNNPPTIPKSIAPTIPANIAGKYPAKAFNNNFLLTDNIDPVISTAINKSKKSVVSMKIFTVSIVASGIIPM